MALLIRVECPGCRAKFKAKEELAGKQVNCPSCGHVIAVRSHYRASQPKPLGPAPQEFADDEQNRDPASQSQNAAPARNHSVRTSDRGRMSGSRLLFGLLLVAVLAAVLWFSVTSERESDAKTVEAMITGPFNTAVDRFVQESNRGHVELRIRNDTVVGVIANSATLTGPRVADTLRLEATIIRDGTVDNLPPTIKARLTDRTLIDLTTYESILAEALTKRDHEQLLKFRREYHYSYYFE